MLEDIKKERDALKKKKMKKGTAVEATEIGRFLQLIEAAELDILPIEK